MERITWWAAAGMAAIITGATVFTSFLPQWTFTSIQAELYEFYYLLGINVGGEFVTALIAIKGVSNAVASKPNQPQ